MTRVRILFVKKTASMIEVKKPTTRKKKTTKAVDLAGFRDWQKIDKNLAQLIVREHFLLTLA